MNRFDMSSSPTLLILLKTNIIIMKHPGSCMRSRMSKTHPGRSRSPWWPRWLEISITCIWAWKKGTIPFIKTWLGCGNGWINLHHQMLIFNTWHQFAPNIIQCQTSPTFSQTSFSAAKPLYFKWTFLLIISSVALLPSLVLFIFVIGVTFILKNLVKKHSNLAVDPTFGVLVIYRNPFSSSRSNVKFLYVLDVSQIQ